MGARGSITTNQKFCVRAPAKVIKINAQKYSKQMSAHDVIPEATAISFSLPTCNSGVQRLALFARTISCHTKVAT